MSQQSAQYWRARKEWSAWVGKKGAVIASTMIYVGSPALSAQTPYPYVVVDFGEVKHSFMGVGHEALQPGNVVECVWRKIDAVAPHEVIMYGIKVKKCAEGVVDSETYLAPKQEQFSAEMETPSATTYR